MAGTTRRISSEANTHFLFLNPLPRVLAGVEDAHHNSAVGHRPLDHNEREVVLRKLPDMSFTRGEPFGNRAIASKQDGTSSTKLNAAFGFRSAYHLAAEEISASASSET